MMCNRESGTEPGQSLYPDIDVPDIVYHISLSDVYGGEPLMPV